MTGNVLLDDNADREADYSVWQVSPDKDKLHVFAEVLIASKKDTLEVGMDGWMDVID